MGPQVSNIINTLFDSMLPFHLLDDQEHIQLISSWDVLAQAKICNQIVCFKYLSPPKGATILEIISMA